VKQGCDARRRIDEIEGPAASGRGFARADDLFASFVGVNALAPIEDSAQIPVVEAHASLFFEGPSCFL
jgi:hypothetical protein